MLLYVTEGSWVETRSKTYLGASQRGEHVPVVLSSSTTVTFAPHSATHRRIRTPRELHHAHATGALLGRSPSPRSPSHTARRALSCLLLAVALSVTRSYVVTS